MRKEFKRSEEMKKVHKKDLVYEVSMILLCPRKSFRNVPQRCPPLNCIEPSKSNNILKNFSKKTAKRVLEKVHEKLLEKVYEKVLEKVHKKKLYDRIIAPARQQLKPAHVSAIL